MLLDKENLEGKGPEAEPSLINWREKNASQESEVRGGWRIGKSVKNFIACDTSLGFILQEIDPFRE